MSTGDAGGDGEAEGAVRFAGLTRMQWAGALVIGVAVAWWTYALGAPSEGATKPRPAPPSAPGEEGSALEPQCEAEPQLASQILLTEELTRALAKRLRDLEASLQQERLPGTGLFAEGATGLDLGAPSAGPKGSASGAVRVQDWTKGKSKVPPEKLLGAFRERTERLLELHLEIEYGRYAEGKRREADSYVHVEVLGETKEGTKLAGVGTLELSWVLTVKGEHEQEWEIASWELKRFYSLEAQGMLFVDALSAMVDAKTMASLERSEHQAKLVALLEHGPSHQPQHPFAYDSLDRHPGLAVVDINRDGYDDIYVMPRWGRNQLLVNQEGRGFIEVAEAWGLDLEDSCSSAIFADFDNDGDKDVVIGRTLKPSLYLTQADGRFSPVARVDTGGALPRLVSSVSVVDYDADGLLDLYFSTYASTMVAQARQRLAERGQLGQSVLGTYLSGEQAITLGEKLVAADYSEHMNRPGPPNALYRNLGAGRFERVESPLGVYKSTFQATWSDMDGDGDPDVYLANDHSTNHLFRNEGGRFVDVTASTGTGDLGFGMGVTWGDYDGDGRFDLYTSNMYSRAGRRMTSALPGLDPRMGRAARGNTLFRNALERFEKTSSLGPEGLEVERAGWSWGAQFGDIDNDGMADLYVLNGHYSAPKEVAIDRDS